MSRKIALKVSTDLTTLIMVFLLFLVLIAETALAAKISVNPTQGPAGTQVTVDGSEWPSGDLIELAWDFNFSVTVANVQVNGDGTFTTPITVPPGARVGPTYIDAGSQAAFLTAQAPFEVTASTVSTTAPVPITISSTTGWQQTGLTLQQGDLFNVSYASGRWTVDFRNFPYVGPDGYSTDIDAQIYQGCKYDSSLVYATLLGQVGSGPVFRVGSGGTFTANASGTLSLRSNDQDACMVDNDGSVTMATEAIIASPEISYLALGDSIAAGHGLDDDKGTDLCRRSLRGYPHAVVDLLARRYQPVDWTLLACSGATVLPPLNSEHRHKWFHYQVDDALARIGQLPTALYLVSITIGANDFEFPMGFARHLYFDDDVTYQAWVDDVIATIKPVISLEVGRFLDRPNVAVIVTGLFNAFNTKSVFFFLDGRCYPFSNCYGRTQYAVNALNTALFAIYQEWGQPARLQFTPVHRIFAGHASPTSTQASEKCGDASPNIAGTWIQYRGDPNSYGFADIPAWLPALGGEPWRGDCFHPNEKGAQAIARAVNADTPKVGR